MAEDFLRAALGMALVLFPGLTWTLAFAPGLGLARGAAVALLLSLTLVPLSLFALNVAFGLPLQLSTMALLAATLGLVGAAVAAGPVVVSRFDA